MEDLYSIILVVVLYYILKPIIKAIFRGFGSSCFRRDQ